MTGIGSLEGSFIEQDGEPGPGRFAHLPMVPLVVEEISRAFVQVPVAGALDLTR